ncbi:hypothetical protein FPQ18DRAFT_419774 [Pyronema domesticum]|nr:hypothetical protein FPQ18DRAFT_419774 [Pyronema domesticum]
MSNLAITLVGQGRWEEAEKLNKAVMDIQRITLVNEHPDILRTIGTLPVTVLEARKKILGDEHLDTLVSMYNLAITLTELGRLDEAEELYMQSLSIKKRVFGVGQHMHARWRPA